MHKIFTNCSAKKVDCWWVIWITGMRKKCSRTITFHETMRPIKLPLCFGSIKRPFWGLKGKTRVVVFYFAAFCGHFSCTCLVLTEPKQTHFHPLTYRNMWKWKMAVQLHSSSGKTTDKKRKRPQVGKNWMFTSDSCHKRTKDTHQNPVSRDMKVVEMKPATFHLWLFQVSTQAKRIANLRTRNQQLLRPQHKEIPSSLITELFYFSICLIEVKEAQSMSTTYKKHRRISQSSFLLWCKESTGTANNSRQ